MLVPARRQAGAMGGSQKSDFMVLGRFLFFNKFQNGITIYYVMSINGHIFGLDNFETFELILFPSGISPCYQNN
jgi:hypothetical protein